jgi:hypothetical protein
MAEITNGMTKLRTASLAVVLAAGLAGLLAGDAATVGVTRPAGEGKAGALRANFAEVKWPFPLDQWGRGRAFRCAPADCGLEVNVYLRAKIGFCNCATGVADDEELDRVGDLELFSDKFRGLADGRTITVGWMSGRSRPYNVAIPYALPRNMLAMAFNDKCDVIVATVVADRDQLAATERFAIDFLNGDKVLDWAKAELGI